MLMGLVGFGPMAWSGEVECSGPIFAKRLKCSKDRLLWSLATVPALVHSLALFPPSSKFAPGKVHSHVLGGKPRCAAETEKVQSQRQHRN